VLTHEQNDLICRAMGDAPMGQLMRRYWMPALLSEELPAPDCAPVQVRMMGEELVAFRDSDGRVGLLQEHCTHRGTSLFYGRNEECGLRCAYHGWKYDVEGNVLDTPAEPEKSTFRGKVRQPSYPTYEAGGMIWAYLGPPEKKPAFPRYSFMDKPATHSYVTKALLECNYLQGLEGECDSSHLNFLHRSFERQGRDLYDAISMPTYETEETDFGLYLVAKRNAPEDKTYVRVSSFVLPISCWITAITREMHLYVPIDDQHSWRYDFGFCTDRPARPEDSHRSPEIGPDYRRIRTKANHYLIDRERQRTTDFTGIENFLNHDGMATETMGPLYDRSKEHLGYSDSTVIAVRRRLIEAAQAFQRGEEPPGINLAPEDVTLSHIDTCTGMVPSGQHWHEFFPHLSSTAPRPQLQTAG
jgi:nitrite reductase/ring-hydroxylating ferredoxin subunit